MEIQMAFNPRAEYRERRSYPNGAGWPCRYLPLDHGCCHAPCKWEWLRAQGLTSLADRLERNAYARDWLNNWGKLLYDPQQHGRHAERRRKAAAVIRAMRSSGLDYATAVQSGVWAGAVIK